MAAMAIPLRAAEKNWITPAEQLEKLIIPDQRVIEQIADTALPVREVASIVAEYACDLSPRLSNWHTALHRFNILPAKISPLPLNIQDKIGPTDLLYWIPPGSLNQFVKHACDYGEAHSEEYGGKNPFQFGICEPLALREYGNTWVDQGQWVLISDALEASRAQPYESQAAMVAELGKEIPRLVDIVKGVFLHLVATGELILQQSNEEEHRPNSIYTCVQETTNNRYHLTVGGFDLDGLKILSHFYGHSIVVPVEKF